MNKADVNILETALQDRGLVLVPVVKKSGRLLGTHRVEGWDDSEANHGLGLMGKRLEATMEETAVAIARAVGMKRDIAEFGDYDYHADGISIGCFCDSIYVTLGPSMRARKSVADRLGVHSFKCSDDEWAIVTALAAEEEASE